MSYFTYENGEKRDIEVSFNFGGYSDIEESLHIFEDSIPFPELSEWSRHDISDTYASSPKISLGDRDQTSLVTITIAEVRASFKNTFGKYNIDNDGFIRNVNILASNTRDLEKGQKFAFETAPNGGDVQFFLIANGYSYNKFLNDSDAKGVEISFVYKLGEADERIAKITDDPALIDLVYKTEEKTEVVDGATYHSNNAHLNHDGKLHSISGLSSKEDTSTLRIGFEDFPNWGDADFNDLVFDVQIFYSSSGAEVAKNLDLVEPASGEERDVFVVEDGDIDDVDDTLGPNGVVTISNTSNEEIGNETGGEVYATTNVSYEHVLSEIIATANYKKLDDIKIDLEGGYIDTVVDYPSHLDIDISLFVEESSTASDSFSEPNIEVAQPLIDNVAAIAENNSITEFQDII